jgi:hypothetical protein
MGDRDSTAVELVITGDAITPDSLTAIAGAPHRAWRKDEPYESRGGRTLLRATGLFAVRCEDAVVELAARALLDRIEDQRDALRAYARAHGASMAIAIWWDPEGGQGGFSLPTEITRRLSELGDRLDVYFPG